MLTVDETLFRQKRKGVGFVVKKVDIPCARSAEAGGPGSNLSAMAGAYTDPHKLTRT